MRLLDLFCGAGGAAMGYHRAGFDEIVGIDIQPQPHYPFEFHRCDALEFLEVFDLADFDAIHASPPCQLFSIMRKGRWQDREHPNLLAPTRDVLKRLGKPYVIENVPGAPLIDPVMLCGSMFGLETRKGAQLRRHRLFECSFQVGLIWPCAHVKAASVIGVYGGGQHPQRRRTPATVSIYGNSGGSSKRDYLDFSSFGIEARREAMGIDWMTGKELSQAIPPAYTEWIGRRILEFSP